MEGVVQPLFRLPLRQPKSESDVNEAAYVVRDEDTVENVVSGLRIEQQQHGSAGRSTRESIPEKDIEDAKNWARERIEAQDAEFGAIFRGMRVPGA
jgi:hypothetical protein